MSGPHIFKGFYSAQSLQHKLLKCASNLDGSVLPGGQVVLLRLDLHPLHLFIYSFITNIIFVSGPVLGLENTTKKERERKDSSCRNKQIIMIIIG